MAKRNDVSVKIDSEAVQIARNVATYKRQSLAEYLSQVVSESAAQEWQSILNDEQKRLGSKGKGDRS